MKILRPYQIAAVEAAFEEWKSVRSTLIKLPTGAGKTAVASEIIRRFLPDRSLFLCHRKELVYQAVRTIEDFTGMQCSIEMGELRAWENLWNRNPVVVSTIQTQIAGNDGLGRMQRFDPTTFALLILDESHHAVSDSWKKVADWYKTNPDLRILNLTATPDRADEEALGQVIDSVAYEYEIVEAINDGWLVNPYHHQIFIEGLDYSNVKTTAGDLNSGELAAIMEEEENVQGVVSACLQLIEKKRTLLFAVSVKQAELYVDVFNRPTNGGENFAAFVHGKSKPEDRARIFADFETGKHQVLVNVGVCTEGYDSPGIECIALARATKSRALYTQMVGRGTRTLTGVIDGLTSPEERKEAIANSAKPYCTILDFVGASGRHKLISMLDILGGKTSDEVMERVRKKLEEESEETDILKAISEEEEKMLQEAEERKRIDAERRKHLTAIAQISIASSNPFELYGLKPARISGWDAGKKLSDKQAAVLAKAGINTSGMGYSQQKQLMMEQFKRWDQGLATFKQCKVLSKHGYDGKNMQMKAASVLIDRIAANGWKRPDPSDIGNIQVPRDL